MNKSFLKRSESDCLNISVKMSICGSYTNELQKTVLKLFLSSCTHLVNVYDAGFSKCYYFNVIQVEFSSAEQYTC